MRGFRGKTGGACKYEVTNPPVFDTFHPVDQYFSLFHSTYSPVPITYVRLTTMNTALKPNVGIVVTRPALLNEYTQKEIMRYLNWAKDHANIILLDENPEDQINLPEFEWDVVITNTGMRPAEYFLANALSVLKEASTYTVAIAFDDWFSRTTVFKTAGVLIVLQPEDV